MASIGDSTVSCGFSSTRLTHYATVLPRQRTPKLASLLYSALSLIRMDKLCAAMKANSSNCVLDSICSCVLKHAISDLLPSFCIIKLSLSSKSCPPAYLQFDDVLVSIYLKQNCKKLECILYLLCFSPILSIRNLSLFLGGLLLRILSMLNALFNNHFSSCLSRTFHVTSYFFLGILHLASWICTYLLCSSSVDYPLL